MMCKNSWYETSQGGSEHDTARISMQDHFDCKKKHQIHFSEMKLFWHTFHYSPSFRDRETQSYLQSSFSPLPCPIQLSKSARQMTWDSQMLGVSSPLRFRTTTLVMCALFQPFFTLNSMILIFSGSVSHTTRIRIWIPLQK